MARTIIIGGGHAGCELAKCLNGITEVVLIEPKEAFLHTPAVIRGLVDPDIAEATIMPYGTFPKHGKRHQASVAQIENDGVILENGERIAGDFIVVATGSGYASPFKPADGTVASLRKSLNDVRSKLDAAQTIAIVGAGPVGLELAGEIAHFQPSKNVHLITSADRLFPDYRKSFGDKLAQQLDEMGITLHLSSRIQDLASTSSPYEGSVTLPNGEKIEADLVFPAIGGRAKTDLLAGLDDVSKDALGRAELDPYLRPSQSHPNLYAIGDAAAAGDAMTIVGLSRQCPWLAKHLKARTKNQSDLGRQYTPWPLAPILVPLGPEKGASVLPIGANGLVVGSWATSMMKGKKLFIAKYLKLLS